MRTLLLVYLCMCTVWGGSLDYDDYDRVSGGVQVVTTPPAFLLPNTR